MEYETKIVDGHEVSYSADWINDLESEMHFNWYFHQASLVYSNCTKGEEILEIGVGTGLLSDLLKKRGWNIKTLDIDPRKRADFNESAVDFDYKKYSIGVVLAFEIFEHIPLSTFEKTLLRIAKGGVENIYFSLPWNERQVAALSVKLPRLPVRNWSLAFSGKEITTRTHFWELGRKDRKFGDGKMLLTLTSLDHIFNESGYRLRRLNKVGNIEYFVASKS
jgi:hypothetical protein